MVAFLHGIRQWLGLALIIGISLLLLFHFVIHPPKSITLPSGQVIKMDTKSFENGVKQILQKVTEQNQKINDLESQIRILQNKTVTQDIPEALKQTDVSKSMETMKNAW